MLNVPKVNVLVGISIFLIFRDIQCSGRGMFSTVSACPAFYMDCRLYCQDAEGNCLQFNGNFIDGTPCGETGTCRSGACADMNSCMYYRLKI